MTDAVLQIQQLNDPRKINRLLKEANQRGEVTYDRAKEDTLTYVANEFEKWRKHYTNATGIVVDFRLRLINDKGEVHRIHPRHFKEYSEWRLAVFERDNFKCQECGSIKVLQAHHIKQYALHPDLRLDLNNGITLCKSCHNKIPRKRLTK